MTAAGTWLGVLIATASGACFYGEPINDRPSAEIQRLANSDLRRGGHVDLVALVSDPDGDEVSYHWTARTCAQAGMDCDEALLTEGSDVRFDVDIPATRADGAVLVTLLIGLDVIDAHGAKARPGQSLVVDLLNSPPSLGLQAHTITGGDVHTVGLPTWFAAQVGDTDDGPDGVVLTWTLEPPRDASIGSWTFDDPGDPGSIDPQYRQEQRMLTAATPGVWTVRATATDPLGGETSAALGITVDADRPPCIAAAVPLAPPVGNALVFDQVRRFEIQRVDDDRAPYPAPTDPYRSTATFRWSLASAAAGDIMTVIAGADGNALELDPANFSPGDVVAVRVEIDDGAGRAMPCAVDDLTCSVQGDSCIQRQTWTLEVR